MEAFAIKGPDGNIISLGITEERAWAAIEATSTLAVKDCKDMGYRYVPVQVTEIEPKAPK